MTFDVVSVTKSRSAVNRDIDTPMLTFMTVLTDNEVQLVCIAYINRVNQQFIPGSEYPRKPLPKSESSPSSTKTWLRP